MRRLQSYINRAVLITTTLATMCAVLGAHAASHSGKMIKVWKIEQTSHLEGNITIYLSSAGVKMLCPVQHIVCVALPPKWDVKITNEKEKIGMTFNNDEWRYRAFRLVDKEKSREKSRVPSMWRGKAAELVVRTLDSSDPVKEQVEMIYRESASRSAEFKSEEFLLGKFMKFEPGVQNFLRGIYGLPTENGLLLRRTRNYPNKRVDTALDTNAIMEVSVPASEFRYQSNFKIAKSLSEVTQRQKKKEQAVNLLEDMFLDK
ncbi:MAG TPA: hypothetical protein EYN91_16290 [Candidatus Melainabacteria bacterium]|nr:hypothetical protein [Candidatus Melainabacteria bacterium]HIN65634.1 hypothetical protein [Candidatus Obscuribacterales bacterium]